MGQKANPILLRLGITHDWDSTWFSTKEYSTYLYEDLLIRNYLRKELQRGGISKILIRRKADQIDVDVFAARPGVIIGKKGVDIAYFREELKKFTSNRIILNVNEEKNPEGNARLLGEFVAGQLEKRIPFRRAMKMAVQRGMRSGLEGILVACAGRLGGTEIARSEWYREGKIPRHTFRANVNYAFTEALTTYGKIGIKVFTYTGERLRDDARTQQKKKRVRIPQGQ